MLTTLRFTWDWHSNSARYIIHAELLARRQIRHNKPHHPAAFLCPKESPQRRCDNMINLKTAEAHGTMKTSWSTPKFAIKQNNFTARRILQSQFLFSDTRHSKYCILNTKKRIGNRMWGWYTSCPTLTFSIRLTPSLTHTQPYYHIFSTYIYIYISLK